METYHKIQSIFKRDMANKGKMILGEFSTPELEYLADKQWEFTEKVDGTNIRVDFNVDPEFVDWADVKFGGRTNNAVIPTPLLEYLQDTFTPGLFRDADLFAITLYGEGYGPKIQGGGKYREDHSFVLFDVKIGGFWLDRANVDDIASKLGIDSVPVIGYGSLQNAIEIVTGGCYLKNGVAWFSVNNGPFNGRMKSRWGDFEAEGIVARPKVPLFNRKGERIIVKIKGVDFK